MRVVTEGPNSDITALLRAWASGEAGAAERALPRVYQQLRRLARAVLRSERQGPQPTELVHELWLRLERQRGRLWRDRAQFLGAAAHVMRQILVDQARRRRADKRGAGQPHFTLGAAERILGNERRDLLALDDALRSLARGHRRAAQVVDLRYFGGLVEREIADVLAVSEKTVRRDLRFAEAFVRHELGL